MDPALAGLAAAAGTALVQAMARDSWETAKAKLSAIFNRHRRDDESLLIEELDAADERLRSPEEPSGNVPADELRRWAGLLADFLAEHREAAPELREFVREVRQLAARDSFSVVQEITAGRDAYAAGRDQHVFQNVDRCGFSGDDEETWRVDDLPRRHVYEGMPPRVYESPAESPGVDVHESPRIEPRGTDDDGP
ncbi:hypothetical protein [Sphaerisporangium fuscum]|uniref:hypothetical protein n=1 Tax=Sphaerisporangium fuscum TaxID=2835868 RepID=UPI001BDCB2E4|nr:hypothetical protein [Sphaerisporangium fuscum]